MSSLLCIDSATAQRADLFPGDLKAEARSSLALVGQWHALFQVLTGEIELGRDAIRISGQDARFQVISGTLGVSPNRFAWPANHSVEKLLELSASLLGMTPQEATQQVQHVLDRFALTPLRNQTFSKLLPLQTRLFGLAHALLGSPRCIAIEDALLGLTTRDSMTFLEALATAREGRALIVSVSHAAPASVERLLVESCEEVLVQQHGALTLQGAPSRLAAPAGLMQITVLGAGAADDGHAVRAAFEAQGIRVRSLVSLPDAAGGLAAGAGPRARLVVELDPAAPTLPLFAAAKSCNSTLLDLHALPNVE